MVDQPSLDHALAQIQCGGWAVSALDYELGYLLEPASAPDGWSLPTSRPLARFWRFAQCRLMDAHEAQIWLNEHSGGAAAGIAGLKVGMDENAYVAALGRIKQYISDGDCYQVNFTFPLDFEWFGPPLALYARLRQQQPVRYGGFVGNAESAVLSLSPELFLERRGSHLLTRPMKGTAPHTASPETLRASGKDRAENLMIVDLLRNDLGRVAAAGSVSVDRLFDIERYPTVWQMVSEISASVGDADLLAILKALFPCGSITGAPKIRAMQIISELEMSPRQLYTGALGWMAPDGDFRLNVAIRTLELSADGRGCMGIGSGVVADSDAQAEWLECLLKARFLRDCDPGLQLIETLRCEDGVWPHAAGHRARLRRSAECLGFPFDEALLENQLQAVPRQGRWRVRLTLNKSGALDVQHFPLGADVLQGRTARQATDRIDSNDPLRRHKTTSRSLYDAALRDLSADSPVFDVLFLNERGEVAEGARSTVFVERDGILLTPPLTSGALPGVLRASLLASGRAREAVLFPEDLSAGFFLGNALRGLIPVTLEAAISCTQEK